ncbi:MAG TPA: entericidin A/B family lipoprotein [Burkholderiales bacterium]|nr:entericidin A/B family lipoprotein [Burkholderiales bacterium]
MKRIVVLLLAAWAITLAGCNTVEGMGKDIRKAGETIEKSAK